MRTVSKVLLLTLGTATALGLGYALMGGASAAQQPSSLPPPSPPGSLIDLPGGLKALPVLQVADDVPAPLLLVLHGREGTEAQLRPFVPDGLGARVFFLRGNVPGPKAKNRWSFFEPKYADGEAKLAPAMKPAVVNLRAAIAELRQRYPTTKVYVLGGSQGGHLAYALAAQGDVAGAVVVSGALPPSMRPFLPLNASVIGIHGAKDSVVPMAAGKDTIDAFRMAGYPLVEWYPIEKGTHALTQAKPLVHQALRKLVRAS